MTVEELNNASEADARQALEACCGSSRWIEGMVAGRPFRSVEDVLSAADEVWAGTAREDWLEAFAHHPRIGETKSAIRQGALASQWSGGEQSSVGASAFSVQERLAEANRVYEDRFGHIYIVCATGRTAEEMLDIALTRLNNDPDTEIRVAAEEQRRITQLRLRKLLGASS